MKIGEQPVPISAIAIVAMIPFGAKANRKAPAVPTVINAVTVRRGPTRSSAQPTGNCINAKVMNQAALMSPSSAGPMARSAITLSAITLRKER